MSRAGEYVRVSNDLRFKVDGETVAYVSPGGVLIICTDPLGSVRGMDGDQALEFSKFIQFAFAQEAAGVGTGFFTSACVQCGGPWSVCRGSHTAAIGTNDRT